MPIDQEQIEQACERFNDRLSDQFSENYQEYRFLADGTAEEVFRHHKQDLKHLLQNVSEALAADETLLARAAKKIQMELSKVLGIVLMARKPGDMSFIDQFLRLLLRDNQVLETLMLSDSALPISRAIAKSLFPGRDRGEDFFETQFRFCAIVLQQEEKPDGASVEQIRCPLPYLHVGRDPIGNGGFGHVFQVEISKHHLLLKTEFGVFKNPMPVSLARKDFQIQNAFTRELKVLKEFMKRPQKHDHLVPLVATLQRETTYSLFFPLASCDLATYFADTRTPFPHDLDAKEALYHRGVGLVGALSFLHNMACYHLDFKPANVLVYQRGMPDEVWKISDFGISSVKIRATMQSDGDSTMATGAAGTYLAPECAVTGGRVSALSDVWSFGCIFSLVLTFIMEGPKGVLDFGHRRENELGGDTFYDRSKISISPAVPEWFGHLKKVPSQHPWPEVIGAALDFLLDKVLLPQRDEREKSSEVEAELKEIWTIKSASRSPSIPNDSRPVNVPLPNSVPPTKPSIFSRSRSISIRGSRFSPRGDILVSYTSNDNRICEPKPPHMQSESLKVVVQIPGDINHISVSNKYICNGLEGDFFKCCIYCFNGDSTNRQPDLISLPGLGSIKMVALSTDGTLAAFIITQEPGRDDMECMRYLCKTEDLINAGSGVHPSPVSSRSNSAVSTPSLGSTRTRSTANQLGPAVGSDADIRFFGFTNDGQFLVMVTQVETITFRVKVWKTKGDTLYQDTTIKHRGSSINTAPHFTACTAFVQDGALHLYLISQEQYLISADLSVRRTPPWQIRKLSNRMVHIQHGIDHKTLIFLKHNRQQIYTLSLSVLKKDMENATLIANGKVQGKPKRDGQINIVLRDKGSGKVEVLLAANEEVANYFDVT